MGLKGQFKNPIYHSFIIFFNKTKKGKNSKHKFNAKCWSGYDCPIGSAQNDMVHPPYQDMVKIIQIRVHCYLQMILFTLIFFSPYWFLKVFSQNF